MTINSFNVNGSTGELLLDFGYNLSINIPLCKDG